MWFSWISLVTSLKVFTLHRIQRDTNFKYDKSRLCTGCCFSILAFLLGKTCEIDSLKRRTPTLSKTCYLLQPKFNSVHRRKTENMHCQPCFLYSSDVIRYRKTMTFSFWACEDYFTFRPKLACYCKTIGNHLNNRSNSQNLITEVKKTHSLVVFLSLFIAAFQKQ